MNINKHLPKEFLGLARLGTVLELHTSAWMFADEDMNPDLVLCGSMKFSVQLNDGVGGLIELLVSNHVNDVNNSLSICDCFWASNGYASCTLDGRFEPV